MCNPIEAPLRSLFERLTLLNGFLHVLDAQSKTVLSTLRRHEESGAVELPPVWYASRILLEDIADIPNDLWRRFAATPHTFLINATNAEEEFNAISETINLFLVSQAYESFETFLLDTVAHLHFAQPDTADDRKKRKWEKRNGPTASLDNWKAYVRDIYRGKNNMPLLNWIGTLAPDLLQVEDKNTLQMPLRRWFATASEIRHAATHSSGLVKDDRFKPLPPLEQKLLLACFPVLAVDNGHALHLDIKSAGKALEVFHNYAYAIHKSLSIAYTVTPAYSDAP
jgi:hypothetical protein